MPAAASTFSLNACGLLVQMPSATPASRNFANAAGQIAKDVAVSEVAYGLAIDFYAWAQVKEAGADKIGFVMPDNLTIITPDGIGILNGAPNPEVAKAFINFVMSEEGQKLWLFVEGSPGGPERFQLNRFSVLPSLYRVASENTAVKLVAISGRNRSASASCAASTGCAPALRA